MKDKTQNSVHTIFPYCKGGQWMFDDEATGLVEEALVFGMPEIIEHFTKDHKNAKKGFRCVFSSQPLPEYDVHLIQYKIEDGGGATYMEHSSRMLGWLCPATLKYFEYYPKSIFVKIYEIDHEKDEYKDALISNYRCKSTPELGEDLIYWRRRLDEMSSLRGMVRYLFSFNRTRYFNPGLEIECIEEVLRERE